MSARRKNAKSVRKRNGQPGKAKSVAGDQYRRACQLAVLGRHDTACDLYHELEQKSSDAKQGALVANDLAALAALRGDLNAAREGLEKALALDPSCEPARANFALLEADFLEIDAQPKLVPQPSGHLTDAARPDGEPVSGPQPIKVAILSLLFNWPSTGGGNVHTFELAWFLAQAGYYVNHIYARYEPWGIGAVQTELPYSSVPLAFDDSSWTPESVKARFRQAVDAFAPDYVIITDSWNFKPHLAVAVRDYPYILRFQAMECLCPLNNVRLLPEPDRQFRQCPLHQLATPDRCAECVTERGHLSGSLHKAERAFSGVGSPDYYPLLLRALAGARAALVVNPIMEAMISPYTSCVRVVTAGMDPARFPWRDEQIKTTEHLARQSRDDITSFAPASGERAGVRGVVDTVEENPSPPSPLPAGARGEESVVLLFAGIVDEWMKGFDVLHEACARLWQRRKDFELVATGDPPGRFDDFTRFVGWLSQDDLAKAIREADILMMPTIAQEALGRTAVEAMAAGRPVIASRIGGLPFTVADGATGLLCEPGNADDLAQKINTLLDSPDLRRQMGLAGRRRFEEHYAWPVIIDRHYKPLLSRREQETVRTGVYRPVILDRVNHEKLAAEISEFFQCERTEVETEFKNYRQFHDARAYAQTLGERKTLCLEEAFILYLLLAKTRPATLVEIGTQHGKSTRRLIDIKNLLGLPGELVTFDIEDQVQHFQPPEAKLVLRDVMGRFAKEVLDAYEPGFVFLDAHPYGLVKEVVTEILAPARKWTLAIHDCGVGLCNPRMPLAKDDPNISSSTGLWERHVLAEVFGVDDPLREALNYQETPTHRFRVFTTPHGTGVFLPKALEFV
jgi:glycosyltransferase involved in cell wall biosynthesis